MSSLHKYISPEYLPKEWGGKKEEYNAKAITKLIKENENKLIGKYCAGLGNKNGRTFFFVA